MKYFSLFKGQEKSRQQSASSYKKPESVLLSERLKYEYKSARIQWEQRAIKDISFARGNQLTEQEISEMKENGQFPVVVNVIQPAIEQAIALLTSNDPEFSCTAQEDSDTKTASAIAQLMKFIWSLSDGSVHLKTAIEDYYIKGIGIMMAYVDPYADFGKGEVKITSLDPFDVFISPNSKDKFCRDSEHVIISSIMTAEQILSKYPETEELLQIAQPTKTKNFEGYNLQDYEGSYHNINNTNVFEYELLDRYSPIKDVKVNIYNPENGKEQIFEISEYKAYLKDIALYLESKDSTKWITEKDELSKVIELAQAGDGYFHLAQNRQTGETIPVPGIESKEADPENPDIVSVPETTVKVIVATIADAVKAGALIENQFIVNKVQRTLSIGGVLYFQNILDIEQIPIVFLINHHDRTPFGLSDVHNVRGLQEEINKIESLIIAHASNSTNIKWWSPMGAADPDKISAQLNMPGAQYLEYNAEIGIPIQSAPPPLPNELYKNKADKIAEIERIMGIYALQQGDASQAPNTYKGTIAIDEFSQRRIKSKRDDIERALNVLGKVVIRLIQKTYTTQKVFRIINPNNQPSEKVAINQPIYTDYGEVAEKINDITIGRYDLVVVSGSTLPSMRWAKADYYKELLSIGAIDQQEFLMKTEVADIEGVLARTGQINQMARQIQELQDMVKKYEGDKQTSDREIIHLRRSLEVEKFKSALAQPKAGVEFSRKLYDARRADELKMFQRELNNKETKVN